MVNENEIVVVVVVIDDDPMVKAYDIDRRVMSNGIQLVVEVCDEDL